MRGVPTLAPILILLAVFGACLGSETSREGCACGPERSSGAGPSSGAPGPAGSGPVLEEPAPSAASAAAASLPDFADPSWTRVTSRAGKYLVCWRSLSGSVPRNQDFELEAWVLRDGAAVRDAELAVSAWMPDHGHGMLRQPQAVAREDGSFHVSGMLLHMRGHWQLFFEVLEGSLSETAECALDL
jgi:hypothetical protein